MRRSAPFLAFLTLLLVACDHGTSRHNPLDPTLTPPVSLQVAADDSNGTVILSWSVAEGQFASYRVLRRTTGLSAVDTLAVIGDRQTTTFIDTGVVQDVGYAYRVSTVNDAGLESASAPQESTPIQLPALRLTRVDFDAPSASATLAWTPYEGARFAAYVLTRSDGTSSQTIARILDRAVVTMRDSLLRGNTAYEYHLSVHTTRDEVVDGGTVAGSFHDLLDSWPFALEPQDDGSSSLRLYAPAGNQIHAVFGDEQRVAIRTLGADGSLLDSDLVTALPFRSSVAATFEADGTRALTVVGASPITAVTPSFSAVGLISLDEFGRPVLQEPTTISTSEAVVGTGGDSFTLETGEFVARAWFDNVSIGRHDTELHVETFDKRPVDWFFEGSTELVTGRWFQDQGWSRWNGTIDGEFVMSADVSLLQVIAGLGVRWHNTYYRLVLGAEGQDVDYGLHLQSYQPGSDWKWLAVQPYAIVPEVPYRVAFGVVDGQLTGWVQSPLLWQSNDVDPATTSLVSIGGRFALTVDERAYLVRADGEASELAPLDDRVGELRTWDTGEGRGESIGVCLPESNRLLLSEPLRNRPDRWSLLMRRQIGPRAGNSGTLFFPLSFDVGPDGRVYVLDAGNARIVVFDEAGQYITEWGSRGSGDGQFDFGDGNDAADWALGLRGSLVVDDDGFVYVADPGNHRIQKFAP